MMNIFQRLKNLPKLAWAAIGVIAVAIVLRLYHITENQFLFYDEGMYLGQNRSLLHLVQANPAQNIGEFFAIIHLMFKTALNTAKGLWFFILNLRVFSLGVEAWYFARIISAVAGLLTLFVVYSWVKHHFNQKIAVLSAVFLAILPSHVFYSRLGMQEALSTLLFFIAIYLFTENRAFGWRVILSAIVLSCVYFTNYRMIIAPIFIGFIELYHAWDKKEKVNWKKLALYGLIFYGIIFFIGNLYGGANRYVTFGWMSYQAQDATGKFDPLNFLSYPYYTFALEGFFFGLLFWSSLRLFPRKEFARLLPFAIVLLQMAMFSFAAEKGARYLCVVLPFMAIAAAIAADQLLREAKDKVLLGLQVALGLMIFFMCIESARLALSTTKYEPAIKKILKHDPQTGIISTQPLVAELYTTSPGQIIPCPKDLASLLDAYKKGARYLVVDPQVYISWTANKERFSPPLIDFLEIARQRVEPLFVLDHLNGPLLKRFVLDHNERLKNSLTFLADTSQGYGQIRVYDLGMVLMTIRQMAIK